MKYFVKNIFSKKAITPIIAFSLLLLVAVSSISIFYNWFSNYQNDFFTEFENFNPNSIYINHLYEDNLYIRNYNSKNLSFSQIKINSKICNVEGVILHNQLNKINLNQCTLNMPIGAKEVVLFTDVGIYTKTLMLKTVTINLGAFSGYGWGENFGFISFNGTGYQVMMNNNELYGKAYSENLGFISFNGSNYGVTNVDGVLTGYAYGEQIGYINFNNTPIYQTTFNGTNLQGHAYSENFGYIHFSYPTFYNIIYS